MKGSIYIVTIEGQEVYKIGMTSGKLSDRIKALQTGNPYKINPVFVAQVSNSADAEKHLHKYFSAYRMRGEWFELTPNQLSEAIKTIQSWQLECTLQSLNLTVSQALEATQTWEATRETLEEAIQKDLIEYMRFLPPQDELVKMLETTPFNLANFLYYKLKIRDIPTACRARKTIGNLLILLDRPDIFHRLKMFGNAED